MVAPSLLFLRGTEVEVIIVYNLSIIETQPYILTFKSNGSVYKLSVLEYTFIHYTVYFWRSLQRECVWEIVYDNKRVATYIGWKIEHVEFVKFQGFK